jgi:dipeptide/tripeptide permease
LSLIYNEKTKLTATWLNALASGSVLVGVVTPTAAVIYGPAQMTAPAWAAGLSGVLFITLGLALHLLARGLLEGLKE